MKSSMRKAAAKVAIWSVMAMWAAVAAGCGRAPAPPPEFVIRAGAVTVSPQEFARELELKLSAYPYDIKARPHEYNQMVLDLVSTLTDETVLLAAARTRGVAVSPSELERREAAIRKDYPEDSFDRMLLENAIEYTVWKNRLKKDMVIEKFIDQDLVSAQEITPQEMVAFYRQIGAGGKNKGDPLDEAGLVRRLRMEKSQSAYDPWMQDLKSAAQPEINDRVLAAYLIHLKTEDNQ